MNNKKLSFGKLCIAIAISFFFFFVLSAMLEIALNNVAILLKADHLTSAIRPFLRDFLCFASIILLLAFLTYGKQFSVKTGKTICLLLLVTFLANLIVFVLQGIVVSTGSMFVILLEGFFEPLITCLIPVVFIMLFVFGIKASVSFKSFFKFPNVIFIAGLFGLMFLYIFLNLLNVKAQFDVNMLNQGFIGYLSLISESPYTKFLNIIKLTIHFLFICVPIVCIYNKAEIS